ncbi:MAG: hypothetical protein ACREEM_20970 [Blastocatellia bacterium]
MTDISLGGARGGLSVARTFTTDLANLVNGQQPDERHRRGRALYYFRLQRAELRGVHQVAKPRRKQEGTCMDTNGTSP